MTDTLVAYFSCSGETEAQAKLIADTIGADIYKIEPKTPYTEADLDWHDKNSRSSVEMRDMSARPEIAGGVHNMNSYDVVFIGFPIWWYVAPSIIKSFLDSYDFGGKKLVLFATSGSSGIEKAEAVLKSYCKNAVWMDGKLVNGMTADDIKTWVKSLAL